MNRFLYLIDVVHPVVFLHEINYRLKTRINRLDFNEVQKLETSIIKMECREIKYERKKNLMGYKQKGKTL